MKEEIINISLGEKSKNIVRYWLLLAISALIFAGLFAFLIAMARTPHIQDILPGKDFFRVALVVHVVLLMVIWFMTFKGILWALTSAGFSGRNLSSIPLGYFSILLAAIGTSLLIIPAWLGLGPPLLINYIPILDHPSYYIGLFLFGLAFLIYLINIFATYIKGIKSGDSLLRGEKTGMMVAGVAIFVALSCYILAYISFPPELKKLVYLEYFFWGGGHMLQFAHTIGMLVAWILLTKLTININPISDKFATFLFSLYLPFILCAPLIFFFYTGGDESFKLAFTVLMQYGYGPTTIILAFMIIRSVFFNGNKDAQTNINQSLPWKDPGFSSLIFSILLFAAGGIIAIFIQGSNTMIPSHYHGVIGAVTISFMGLTYKLIPILDHKIAKPRLAVIQPYLYGIGQLMFVLGMFWAGSHGVARKTYGAAQGLDNFAKLAAMTLMGIGGLVAIAGGASFVFNSLLSLLGKKTSNEQDV